MSTFELGINIEKSKWKKLKYNYMALFEKMENMDAPKEKNIESGEVEKVKVFIVGSGP